MSKTPLRPCHHNSGIYVVPVVSREEGRRIPVNCLSYIFPTNAKA